MFQLASRLAWCSFLIAVVPGCGDENLRYVGTTSRIEKARTPAGFNISPVEANRILRDSNSVHRLCENRFYQDGSNYVIVGAFEENFHGKDRALPHSYVSGTTGRYGRRKTEVETVDPDYKETVESPID